MSTQPDPFFAFPARRFGLTTLQTVSIEGRITVRVHDPDREANEVQIMEELTNCPDGFVEDRLQPLLRQRRALEIQGIFSRLLSRLAMTLTFAALMSPAIANPYGMLRRENVGGQIRAPACMLSVSASSPSAFPSAPGRHGDQASCR